MDFDAIRIDSVNSLSAAAAIGDNTLLREFLSEKREDPQDNRGWRAIHHAVYHKQIESIKLLLSDGNSDINWKSFEGTTPLHLGVKSADLPTLRAVLRSSDIDINSLHPFEGSCIHMALNSNSESIRFEMLRILIRKGANVNLANGFGEYPLHLACRNDVSGDSVEVLLLSGADILAQDEDGLTPLMVACEMNNLNAVRHLIAHPRKNIKSILIDMESNSGHKALHFATFSNIGGDPAACVKILCEEGADPDEISSHDGLPLICNAIGNSTTATVEILLKYMDLTLIHSRPSYRDMMLKYAVLNAKDFGCIKVLLEYGIDFNPFRQAIDNVGQPEYIFKYFHIPTGLKSKLFSFYLLSFPFKGRYDESTFEVFLSKIKNRKTETFHPLVALSINSLSGEIELELVHRLFNFNPELSDDDINLILILGGVRIKIYLLQKGLISLKVIQDTMTKLNGKLSRTDHYLKWKTKHVRSLFVNLYIISTCFGDMKFINSILGHSFYHGLDNIHLIQKLQEQCLNPKSLKKLSRKVVTDNNIIFDLNPIPMDCRDLIQFSDISSRQLINIASLYTLN